METTEQLQRQQQEADWKTDEEFKKFMGNPSIEAAIKLEKKRADRKLKELDMEAADGNPITCFLKSIARDPLAREKERLEKVEEAFKALDLNKLKSCFGYNTFFAVDVRRFGDGGIFIGNLRKPIEEVIPKLQRSQEGVVEYFHHSINLLIMLCFGFLVQHNSRNKKCYVCNKPTMGIFNTTHEIRKNLQNVYSSAIDAIDSFILSCINQEVEFNYNLFSVVCAVVLKPRAHLPNFVCAAFFVCFFTNANVDEHMLSFSWNIVL